MIVVADSTPLITMMKADQLALLHALFGEIRIPVAVFEEVTDNLEYANEADLIRNSSYIKVVEVEDPEQVILLRRATALDRGESEAIIYADQVGADLLLMDETAGRAIARNMNLRLTGSVGVLILAIEKGILSPDDADMTVEKIRSSRRHISEELLQRVKAAAQTKRMHGLE